MKLRIFRLSEESSFLLKKVCYNRDCQTVVKYFGMLLKSQVLPKQHPMLDV